MTELAYWRVWVDGVYVRVARTSDGQDQHLELVADGVEWVPHDPGDSLPAIHRQEFCAWFTDRAGVA